MSSDPAAVSFGLGRFVSAQGGGVYETALAELQRGRKRTHWMWFVFPQYAGLGHSETARYYAIGSRAEAVAYLAHPLLGERIRTCTSAVLKGPEPVAERLFGPVDVLKFRSSLTLFDAVGGGGTLFHEGLARFFGGARDDLTLQRLAASA